MDIFILEWLNKPMWKFGWFDSLEAAHDWVDKNDAVRWYGYKVIRIERNVSA